ncbi:MAG: hypothetical protein GY816_01105 [Cytophagales bacterium]|nr:hypothetical protein [Cytophagales bacterium]
MNTQKPIADVFEDYNQERLLLFPFEATSIGDNRFNNILPNNLTQSYNQEVNELFINIKT